MKIKDIEIEPWFIYYDTIIYGDYLISLKIKKNDETIKERTVEPPIPDND